MPDQRDKNKVSKGVWIDKKLRDLSVAALKKKGVPFSEAVEDMLLNLISEQLTEAEQREITRKSHDKKRKD